MNINERIINLKRDKPKHYVKIIKKTPELLTWVEENSLAISDNIIDHIHSALTQKSNVCVNGNYKKYSRNKNDFVGCGPAKTCKCTRDRLTHTSLTRTVTPETQILINEKRKTTMEDRYGVPYNSQRPDVKEKLSYCRLPKSAEHFLKDKEWLCETYVINNTPSIIIAEELGVHYSTVLDYCRTYGFDIRKTNNKTSIVETNICDFIRSYGIVIQTNDRELIDPYELDIVIPDKHLAIEINGLYWHSYTPKVHVRPKQYNHLNKTQLVEQLNLKLFHITDWQWYNKQEIIKSMIKNKLGLNSNKIHARKTIVIDITPAAARKFYNRTHLKGFRGANKHIGLIYDDTLVMCMSVSKKKDELHIERIATELDAYVIGGANKLLSYIGKLVPSQTIISYCDRSHSNGNVYEKMGFELVGETGIDYFWTDGTNIISRQKTQHSQLKKWLTNYDPSLTEQQNMFNNNYRIYYGCGSLKYAKTGIPSD